MKRQGHIAWMFGALLSALLMLASAATAQTITTGTLSGTILDKQSNPLPGARVEAVHTSTGTVYTAVTRTDGQYSILNVRVGTYSVKVTMSGFKDATTADVAVGLGENRAVNFKLELAAVTETVTVKGELAPIDLTQAGTAGNISNAVKEALPTISRSITDLVRTNVYFNPMGLNDDTPVPAVAGRSQRFNSFQIDGAVNNDLFGLSAGGGTPGGNAGTQPISLDAIQELQLVVSPYDIRQSGFSGGGINAVTKSGTNQMRGTGYFFGRNQSMVGDGISRTPISDFSDYQGGVSLGGPIKANRAFYFGNYESQRKLTPTGFSVGGSGVQAFPGNEALVDQFLSDLKNIYGYDLGANAKNEYSKPANNDKVFLRADFNIGTSQLTIRHNFINAFQDVGFPSTSTYTFPDAFYRFKSRTNSTVGQLTSRLGQGVNELRIASTEVRENRQPLPAYETIFPNVSVTLVGTQKVTAGLENFSGANELDQTIVEITDDYTRQWHNHQLTIGTHNEIFDFRNLFIRDYYGTYSFDSLTLFEQGLSQSFSHSFSATSDPQQAAKFGVRHMGLYAGDQWRAKSNLTLTYGVRADFVHYPDTPSANPLSEQYFGYRTDVVPNNTLVSPRVGVNWSLKQDGSEQIRGGIGSFAGRTPYVWISNQYGNTGIDFTRLSVTNNNKNRIPFVADPYAQYTDPSQITGAAASVATNEIDLIDPNFKYPSMIRGNLAYDRKLPGGWYSTVEFLYTWTVNDIRYENLNLQQIATSNIDGRPFYAREVPTLSDVLLLTNTNKGNSWTIAAEGKRPFHNGLFVDVSYIYGRSRTIMDGTRDQALSTWGNAYTTGDPNNPPLGISDYDPGHRINVTGSYTKNLFKDYTGTVTIFYSGQSGRPYTVLWGSPGVNGDGQSFNDIIFLMPTAPDGVTITNGSFQSLLDYFNAYPCLQKQLGQAMERNSCRSPWTNTMDGRFALTLPAKRVHTEVTLDILNMLNLMNRNWGVFRYANFNDVTPVSETVDSKTGKVTAINVATVSNPNFSPFVRGDLRSRAQLQIGLRVRF